MGHADGRWRARATSGPVLGIEKLETTAMRRNYAAWTAIALSSAALVSSQNWGRLLPAAPQEPAPVDLSHAKALERAFEGVALEVAPCVVQISVRQSSSGGGEGRMPDGFPGMPRGERDGKPMTPDEMQEFMDRFRRFFPQMPDDEFRMEKQQFQIEGTGSGFVFDDKGHIVTNNHVVEGAEEGGISVRFQDGTVLPAKVIGTDARTDIAVIKVESTTFRAAKIGASEDLKVGQIVLAIGSPFGLEQTVTQGIVSATHRTGVGILDAREGFEDFVQTDAAINPGNSGGPLVNLDGEVIGVNSAIATNRRAMNSGVGFAVPIDLARHVAVALIEDGRVRRARMGVVIRELTPDLAEPLGLAGRKGILVDQVAPDSPASRAGLQPGDVLISLNGDAVTNVPDFRLDVSTSSLDEPVEVEYIREGRTMTASVTLAPEEQVGIPTLARDEDGRPPSEAEARDEFEKFGLTLLDLDGDNAGEFGYGDDTRGILVRKVAPDSVASAQGIEAGDLITRVVKSKKITPVATVDELIAATGEDVEQMAVYIQKPDGQSQFVALKLED